MKHLHHSPEPAPILWINKWIRTSVSNRAVFAALVLVVVMSLLMAMASIPVLYNQISTNHAEKEEAQAQRLQELFEYRIDSISKTTNSLAHNSFIINGFLDSDGRDIYLRPLLRNFKIPLGIEGNVIILDTNTDLIAVSDSTDPNSEMHKQVATEVLQSGKQLIRLNGDRVGLLFASPVYYPPIASHVGVAIIEVPVHALFDAPPRFASEKRCYTIAVDSRMVHRSACVSVVQATIQKPTFSIHSDFSGDSFSMRFSEFGRPVAVPIVQILLTYLAFCVAAILVAMWVTRSQLRALTQPLIDISRVAQEISTNPKSSAVAPELGEDEVGKLGRAFNLMLADLRSLQTHLENRIDSATSSLLVAKQQAEAASEAKGQFLANMSHEIRTPLNAVMGVTHLLADSDLTHDQRQLVFKAQMAGRSLLGIINDVLDLAKIEAGEMALDEAIFLPAELLYELEAVYGAQVRSKGLSFHVHSAADVPHGLLGDSGRLRQILTNLIGNALKFTAQGGVEVRVSVASRLDNRLVLHASVRDTGIGIEPEVQARLFQPFTQADVSTTRHFGGTGLGLSIVRRLAELMGGEIGLNSSPGSGSEFWVTVPMSVPSAEQMVSLASTTLEVMLVDDKPDDRMAMAAMARALGWRPTLLDSGNEMVRQLQQRATAGEALPAALVVNWAMPGMDGLQALQRLSGPFDRELLPTVLMVAPEERKRVADLCRDHHLDHLADHMLSKPVGNSALFNAVNAVIAQRGESSAALALSLHPSTASGGWLPHVHVLVVDDSDINLDIARRLLERQGAKVQTCSNGQKAVDMLRHDGHGWDLVLMDVQMPIMDGLEATRRIRGELGLTWLPIVALTAGALSEERKRAMAAGMNEFLSKPLDPQAMVRTIKELVERRRGQPLSAAPAEPAAPIAEQPLTWPQVAGIDTAVAQRNLGGDWTLFVSILQRLFSEYEDLITAPLIEPEDVHREALVARMHKLRGSVGTVGATEMYRLGTALEGALRTPGCQVLAELQALSHALVALRDAMGPLLTAEGVRWTAAQQNHNVPPFTDAQREELLGLLQAHDLAAMDRFDQWKTALVCTMNAADGQRFCAAMQSLEFQQAASLLGAVKSSG